MINPETKENREYILTRYEKFEALIRCYGALMNKNVYDEKKFREDYFVNELLSMSTIPALHPNLLNGLCLFIDRLLNNE
jgi:hypothetical protein